MSERLSGSQGWVKRSPERTFDRVSYALILTVQEPVRSGDRFTQP